MTTVEFERAALVEATRHIPGLNVYAYWPDYMETPALLVNPTHQVADEFGRFHWMYELELLLNNGDAEASQVAADLYCSDTGPYSIREALESDPTLKGIVPNIDVGPWSGYGGRRTETAQYVGAALSVEVYR